MTRRAQGSEPPKPDSAIATRREKALSVKDGGRGDCITESTMVVMHYMTHCAVGHTIALVSVTFRPARPSAENAELKSLRGSAGV